MNAHTTVIKYYLAPNLQTWRTNALELVERYADPHEAFEELARKIQRAVTAARLDHADVQWGALASWIKSEAGL